jgi:hypothetical protein
MADTPARAFVLYAQIHVNMCGDSTKDKIRSFGWLLVTCAALLREK